MSKWNFSSYCCDSSANRNCWIQTNRTIPLALRVSPQTLHSLNSTVVLTIFQTTLCFYFFSSHWTTLFKKLLKLYACRKTDLLGPSKPLFLPLSVHSVERFLCWNILCPQLGWVICNTNELRNMQKVNMKSLRLHFYTAAYILSRGPTYLLYLLMWYSFIFLPII